MKRIAKEEVKTVARIMTDCFWDYPLYRVFFPKESQRKQQLFYFCWYYIYVRQRFTYLSEDQLALVSVQKPGEQFCSPIPLLLHPTFLFGAIRHLPISALLQLLSYAKLTNAENRQFYHPDTDWFVHSLCASAEARGNNVLKILREMDEGAPLYCFTHTQRNMRLYKLLGFEVQEEIQWNNIPVYTMHREGKH